MSEKKNNLDIESEATLVGTDKDNGRKKTSSAHHAVHSTASHSPAAHTAAAHAAQKTPRKKTAKKKKKISAGAEKKLEKAAGAAGAALMGLAAEEAKTKEGRKKLLIIGGIIIAAALVLFIVFKPQILELLGMDAPTPVAELSPEHSLTHTALDFQNAVLGESRSKKDLVVLEQDVKVDSKISQKLLDMSVFKKTKKIHSYGTGIYTVDLSKLSSENIKVDDAKKTVTITIPRTTLQYVNIDVKKTEFEDTKKGFLGFGDIKFTQEQQKALEESIDSAMRKVLDTDEMFEKADETAVTQVTDIFSPLIKSVAGDYEAKIEQ